MKREPPAELISLIRQKKVLFIASKNRDYLRIAQEIELLNRYADTCRVLCYRDKSYLVRMLKLFIALLFSRTSPYDVIFVGFLPQMVIPFFSWKWHGKMVITDFFISVYDTLVWDRRIFRDRTIAARILKRIDCITIRKSGYIIADTQAHAAYFMQDFHARADRTFVWYLRADTSIYNCDVKRSSTKFSECFQVLYFGSILPLQGVEYVLRAAELLQAEHEIRFVVIGPVREEKKSLENVTFVSWLSQPELAKWIAGANLCLAGHFASDIQKARRTIPGKAYIYEAMDKPMVLGDNPANHELFREDEKHFYVEMGNAQALAETIRNQYEKFVSNRHE